MPKRSTKTGKDTMLVATSHTVNAQPISPSRADRWIDGKPVPLYHDEIARVRNVQIAHRSNLLPQFHLHDLVCACINIVLSMPDAQELIRTQAIIDAGRRAQESKSIDTPQ
jgi:hypothetical protein